MLSVEHQLIMQGKICPYCRKTTDYVDSSTVYGKSYGMIYLCKPCDAYVGVHKGTDNALGRLADRSLRFWKKQAHFYFDQLWQAKYYTRHEAYKLLSDHLKIPAEYTHIGMFSIETCQSVISWAYQKLRDLKHPMYDTADQQ